MWQTRSAPLPAFLIKFQQCYGSWCVQWWTILLYLIFLETNPQCPGLYIFINTPGIRSWTEVETIIGVSSNFINCCEMVATPIVQDLGRKNPSWDNTIYLTPYRGISSNYTNALPLRSFIGIKSPKFSSVMCPDPGDLWNFDCPKVYNFANQINLNSKFLKEV